MRHVKKGLLITFEGPEGSGKTTQIQALSQWLRDKGYSVISTREPGGTPLADRIRRLLLNSKNKNLTSTTELFLYEVARRDHISEVIRPALQSGKIILCDRFTDATLAYQGFGRGLPLKIISTLNNMATGGIKPYRTFLFDLPVEVGLNRAHQRIKKLKKGSPQENRFEKESKIFHYKIREGYLTLARREKRRFKIIDARQSRHTIFLKLRHEMEKIL